MNNAVETIEQVKSQLENLSCGTCSSLKRKLPPGEEEINSKCRRKSGLQEQKDDANNKEPTGNFKAYAICKSNMIRPHIKNRFQINFLN